MLSAFCTIRQDSLWVDSAQLSNNTVRVVGIPRPPQQSCPEGTFILSRHTLSGLLHSREKNLSKVAKDIIVLVRLVNAHLSLSVWSDVITKDGVS